MGLKGFLLFQSSPQPTRVPDVPWTLLCVGVLVRVRLVLRRPQRKKPRLLIRIRRGCPKEKGRS